MKLSKLLGNRLREAPKDSEIISHQLLYRAGYIRQNAAGIYSYLPLAYRVMKKIMEIIREEMDLIDGQEVLLPLVNPKEMWEQTGRYNDIGSELVRFKDKSNKDFVLAMTHEEAVAFLGKSELFSYKQFPFMIYQFQLKYRDEHRPRGGLIRVKEFTMKDAYSFHIDENDLDNYYYKVYQAYNNIFDRVGMKNYVSVQSDTGMMGGKIAHEFMCVTDSGEDSLVLCSSCDYKANEEIATSILKKDVEQEQKLEEVNTPNVESIEEVSSFLNISEKKTGKVVFYTDENKNIFLVMIRGDYEVNDVKLKNYLRVRELNFADHSQIESIGCVPGYASPLDINDFSKVRVIIDSSITKTSNIVVGANKKDYHLKNFNYGRDFNDGEVVDIRAVKEGDICPKCGNQLMLKRGIEIGNIFQLGDKYTNAYDIKVLDQNGKSVVPKMCSYGIGIGRLLGSLVEDCHDENGIVWPSSVAPFHVHIILLSKKVESKKKADELYMWLKENKIEVLYDDRKESPGVKFNDADLIGIPVHMIISDKNLKDNKMEIKSRKTGERIKCDFDNNLLLKKINDIID